MIRKTLNKPNFFDKFFTGILFAIVIVCTVAVLPLIMISGGMYNYYSILFIKLVGIVALIIGFILPIDKVFSLIGHFWLTEKQPRLELTLLAWGTCFGIGYITHFFILK